MKTLVTVHKIGDLSARLVKNKKEEYIELFLRLPSGSPGAFFSPDEKPKRKYKKRGRKKKVATRRRKAVKEKKAAKRKNAKRGRKKKVKKGRK